MWGVGEGRRSLRGGDLALIGHNYSRDLTAKGRRMVRDGTQEGNDEGLGSFMLLLGRTERGKAGIR